MLDSKILLQTKRLTLIPLAIEHADDLFEIWSNDAVTEFMDIDTFTNIDNAKQMIEFLIDLSNKETSTRYTILDENKNIIGTIGLNTIDTNNFRAEIGYELAQSTWGKGYGTEVLTGYLEHEITKRNLHRIEAFIVPDNLPSIKLVEKIGFEQEAILKDYEYKNDKFQDMLLFRKII